MNTAQRRARLGMEILQNCRNELYVLFPALDGAFASLDYRCGSDVRTIGTEGERISFSPAFLIKQYAENPAVVRRGYLHILLHCLFLHPFRRRPEPRRLWALACDMAVEKSIPEKSRLTLPANPVREACLSAIGEDDGSAERIFAMLRDGTFPFSTDAMEAAFRFDDHSLWRHAGASEKWARILAYTRQNQGNQRRGTKSGGDREAAAPAEKSRYRYRDFLHRFTTDREELQLDQESFDYILYHFGMEHYGNLPLIEHLEYQEVNRLEELVIAIDTSGSCTKEMVQQYLAEMLSIFQEKENFFQKMRVYLIQCDCCIQDVAVIRSEDDWRKYSEEVVIQGRGGTDFTPVFRYVDELRKKKKLRDLRALLYFTDGDGAYPRSKPDYETAFILLSEAAHPELVPPWAVKLLIG